MKTLHLVSNNISQKFLIKHIYQQHFPKFKYNAAKDLNINELDILRKKYLQTKSLEDKKRLLILEREMLYEEYEKPELTLARNSDKIAPLLQYTINSNENVIETIKTLNINAIMRMEAILTSLLTTSDDKNKYMRNISQVKILKVLKDALEKLNNTKNSEFVRDCVNRIFCYVYAITPFSKESCKDFKAVLKNQYSKDATSEIYFNKLCAEFKNAKTDNSKAIKHVNVLLNNKDCEPDVRKLAILAAGKYKSKENYEILKRIALDTTEESPIVRQNAIQSLALYIRKNNQEVKKILENIKQENSLFSPLATILLDKLNGTYHGKINVGLEYNFYENSNISSIRDKINRILELDINTNKQIRNKVDSQVMPFVDIFEEKKIIITDDTITKYDEKSIGNRYFYFTYPNCGEFADSIDGIANEKGAIISKHKLQKIHFSVISHELGHCLNYLFDKLRAQKKLNQLYKQALKNDNFLDYYAALNPYEYFAQGCEAYTSIYKPHKELFSYFDYNSTHCHTRYELLERDPELYNFVEKMLSKYKNE